MPLHREYERFFSNTLISRFNGLVLCCDTCAIAFTQGEQVIGHISYNQRQIGPQYYIHAECLTQHYDTGGPHYRHCRWEPQNDRYQQYTIYAEETEVEPDYYEWLVTGIEHTPAVLDGIERNWRYGFSPHRPSPT